MDKTITVGELLADMNAGRVTREQVAKALQPLEVIHHWAKVTRPEPETDDIEMGA